MARTTTVTKAEPVLEWRLQHAIVRRFAMLQKAGYDFDFAGDQNAAKRGPQAATIAKATGMRAGEPDVRIYLRPATLKMIELKVSPKGELSDDQKTRHELLIDMGFDVVTLYAFNEDEAADLAESALEAWVNFCPVAANDNTPPAQHAVPLAA